MAKPLNSSSGSSYTDKSWDLSFNGGGYDLKRAGSNALYNSTTLTKGNDFVYVSSVDPAYSPTLDGLGGADQFIFNNAVTSISDSFFANIRSFEVAKLGNAGASISLGGSALATGIVDVSGGDGADTITFAGYGSTSVRASGGAGNDVITTSDGNDTLIGGGGDDVLHGGRGVDTFYVDSGTDTLVVGEIDAAQDEVVIANGATAEITVSQDYTGFNWTPTSATVNNGTANIYVETSAAGVNLDAAGGANGFTIHLGSDGDNATGSKKDDVIYGGLGNDNIDGNDGDDVIAGGGGIDTLKGGAGADTFVFEATATDNGSDLITDFTVGSGGDVLDFSAFLPTGSFSTGDWIVATNGWNGSAEGSVLNATNKVVQLWSLDVDSSADVNEASEIYNAFSGGTPVLSLDAGGKAVVLSGEDTVNTQNAYVWFVNDAGNDGVDLGDIQLVATLNSVQLGHLDVSEIIFAV